MEHLEEELCLLLTEIRLFFEEELYFLLTETYILCLYVGVYSRFYLKVGYCRVMMAYCRIRITYYQVKRGILCAIPARCFVVLLYWRKIKRACLLSSLRFIVRQLEQVGLHD
jgi:hypothetical protein